MLRRVGVIGTGNLGQHLVKMLLKRSNNYLAPFSVIGSVRSSVRHRELTEIFNKNSIQIQLDYSNSSIADRSNVVILSVKPGQIKDVCKTITPFLLENVPVISAAAAIPLDKLHEWLPSTNTIIRCMPNVPCSIGTGLVTYYSRNENAKGIMNDIFAPNVVIPVNSDAEMDMSTLISGCGPAFFSWYVECIKRVGITVLPCKTLDTMLTQTMIGTGKMLETQTSAEIIKTVASPKGATETALSSLNANKVDEEIGISILTAQRRIEIIASNL